MAIKTILSAPKLKPVAVDEKTKTVGDNPERINRNLSDIDVRLSPVNKEKQELTNDPEANQNLLDLKIEQNRIIPYATFHVQNFQVDEIKEILQARKIEKQIQQSIITKLYELANDPALGNPDLVQDISDSLKEQITSVEKTISAVESVKISYDQIENVFQKLKQTKSITEKVKSALEDADLDPVNSSSIMTANSYLNLLIDLTANPLIKWTNRSLTNSYLQILIDMDWTCLLYTSPSPRD